MQAERHLLSSSCSPARSSDMLKQTAEAGRAAMVPATFGNFFVASAGAGAALAGLLFLAVTAEAIKSVDYGAPVERRSVSSSAFLGLINAFFIFMAGLIPDTNLGITALLAHSKAEPGLRAPNAGAAAPGW